MGIGRRALRIGLLVLVVAALGALSAARVFGPQILERAVVLEAKRRLGLEIRFGALRGDLRAEIRGLSLEARFAGILHPRFEFETSAAVSAFRRSRRIDLQKVSVQGKVSAHGLALDSLLIEGQSGPLRASGALDD